MKKGMKDCPISFNFGSDQNKKFVEILISYI